MALCHSSGVHYNLLVKNDSRLALLGLLAGSDTPKGDDDVFDKSPVKKWMDVKTKKRNNSKKDTNHKNMNEEKLLGDTEDNIASSKDIDDEIILIDSKNNGFRRTGPQEKPERVDNKNRTYKCSKCLFEFMSAVLLETHKKTH